MRNNSIVSRYNRKAVLFSMLFFVFMSIMGCGFFSFFIKSHVQGLKSSVFNSGLFVANMAEYRRSVAVKIMSQWKGLTLTELLSAFKQAYVDLPPPSYVYDIGPFILNNDLCFSMKDNDKNYCDGILNSALYLERRNDGIILLDGVKYIYFVQPLRDNIQLVFLVDATHYVTLVKKQYPFGIFLSMDVFTQGRSIYSDDIGQSLVFPVTAFTSGLNYLPELTYVFGFSKRIFLLVCSVIIILAAVISCVIYKTYFSLIYGIYDQGLKETRAITENQLSFVVSGGLYFNDADIRKLHDIFYAAIYDSLTGAYSRKSFDDSIKDIIGTGDSYLCFFDVDRFKFVNDNFGHLFGDEVLIYVVHYLKDKMNGFNFRIYRFGGDEFAIIYSGELCDLIRILKGLTDFEVGGLRCSCSFGVAAEKECTTAEALKLLADNRLYFSKNNGRSQITWK
ncbi:diguanylate cyclase [Escherichia coli]|uniref:GGDEF domain-containing protein n=1 Tax=Escherichia coli TaxID=562 RepID=UPI0015D79829|nr:GGDEF domain-containing protein [Escherichia coli]NZB52731.1 diguanylate cyclase [Escherichia coli]